MPGLLPSWRARWPRMAPRSWRPQGAAATPSCTGTSRSRSFPSTSRRAPRPLARFEREAKAVAALSHPKGGRLRGPGRARARRRPREGHLPPRPARSLDRNRRAAPDPGADLEGTAWRRARRSASSPRGIWPSTSRPRATRPAGRPPSGQWTEELTLPRGQLQPRRLRARRPDRLLQRRLGRQSARDLTAARQQAQRVTSALIEGCPIPNRSARFGRLDTGGASHHATDAEGTTIGSRLVEAAW